jgi:hypothetical protein
VKEGGEFYEIWDLGFEGETDPAGGDGKMSAPAFSTEKDPENASQKEVDAGARVFGSKNDADERKIQHIPAEEPGTESNQLAEELLREFSQGLAPDRLN